VFSESDLPGFDASPDPMGSREKIPFPLERPLKR